MKLLSKLNTRYISYSLSIMAITGIMIYVVISAVVTKQLDEKLTDISVRIGQKLSDGGKVDWLKPFVEVSEVGTAPELSVFSDTLIMNKNENEQEEYRQLTVVRKINQKYYQIDVRESKLESEDLIGLLAGIILFAVLLLTGSLIIVNRRVAKSIWTPFYKNLHAIEDFSIQNNSQMLLGYTGITEFDALNNAVTKLTNQIASDFRNIKQFSEDASHEIQTPLAIISAKMESILNDQGLTEPQLETIRVVLSAVNRLSKLNKELLLLTKIENNQFMASEKINLKKILHDKLLEFQELLEIREITVDNQCAEDFEIECNPVLAELMINNLLSNAINHNIRGGSISISGGAGFLEIRNTGRSEIAHPEKLFTRFYKENPSSNSVGLGLAIVAKICEVQGWKVSYSFIKPLHGFHVSFKI